MQFYLIASHLDENDKPWKEKEDRPEITTLKEAGVWGEEIIKGFNATLRPGEKPRKYVGVEKISDLTEKHAWEKTNLVTIIDKAGAYDAYRCNVCGVTGKRYGIGSSIHRDSKFRAEKYSLCDPNRRSNVHHG